MDIRSLIAKTRSYRRFDGNHTVDRKELLELVELARLSGSSANLQPLKYVISCSREVNEKIFATLGWAGYLRDWPGPIAGERPTAYIVILVDTNIRSAAGEDIGIATQSIMLGACERGLGGCMIGSVRREQLRQQLGIPGHLDISFVLALGKPAEQVVIEDLGEGRAVEYYRDAEGIHHVPKRCLQELVVKTFE